MNLPDLDNLKHAVALYYGVGTTSAAFIRSPVNERNGDLSSVELHGFGGGMTVKAAPLNIPSSFPPLPKTLIWKAVVSD